MSNTHTSLDLPCHRSRQRTIGTGNSPDTHRRGLPPTTTFDRASRGATHGTLVDPLNTLTLWW